MDAIFDVESKNVCNRSARLLHFVNEWGERTAKVDGANADTYFGLLISGIVAFNSVGE